MEFVKYHSLENSYREKFVNACQELGIKKWVALEKIDGANLSYIVDGDNVQVASRNAVLGKSPEGSYEFFGATEVIDKYIDPVKELSQLVGDPVRVFGELFGSGIQKRIKYGEKDFIVFDIQLEDGTFLPWDTVVYLCDLCGIPYVPELGRGTLDEMLSISPEFTSKLCEDLSEGLVIKPIEGNHLLRTGSRPILKQKSKAFSEKTPAGPKPKVELTSEQEALYTGFSTYINESRLGNVLSKFGVPTQKDFGKVMGLLMQDAKEDYVKDNGEVDSGDWKVAGKLLGKLASEVVRRDWLNIIDGGE